MLIVLVLPLQLLLWFGIFSLLVKPTDKSFDTVFRRLAFSILSFCIMVVLGVELLSFFHQLTFSALVIFWITNTLILMVIALWLWRKKKIPLQRLLDYRTHIKKLSQEQWFIFGLYVVFVLVLLTIALAYPPKNWDAMTYHMARIPHWIQNQTVDVYATSISRQIYQPPFSGYLILNLQILSGTHRFANLVQLSSFALIPFINVAIIRLFTHSKIATYTSFILSFTLPMAILQATSPQNDLVASVFILLSVYFIFSYSKSSRWYDSIFFACALSLAIATKGTSYVILAPFSLLLAGFLLCKTFREKRFRYVWLLIPLIFVLVNIGHYARNYSAYGNILGGTSSERSAYSNETISPKLLSSNFIRNTAMHLGTPSGLVNRYVFGATQKAHDLLGLELNDSRITWGTEGFTIWNMQNPLTIIYSEDFQTNQLHTYTLIGVLPIALFGIASYYYTRRTFLSITFPIIYTLTFLLSVVFFVGYLRWQPWISRLHTPLFYLSIPIIAMVLKKFHITSIVYSLLALFIFTAVPFTLLNDSRPLLRIHATAFDTDTVSTLFYKREYLKKSYELSTQTLLAANPDSIGLVIGGDAWEYPIWFLLGQHIGGDIQIEHMYVLDEELAAFEDENFKPEYIFAMQKTKQRVDENIVDKIVYEDESIIVYKTIYN